MSVQEQLKILAGAIRHGLRQAGINPAQATDRDVIEAIDEWAYLASRGDNRIAAKVAESLLQQDQVAYKRRINQVLKLVRQGY